MENFRKAVFTMCVRPIVILITMLITVQKAGRLMMQKKRWNGAAVTAALVLLTAGLGSVLGQEAEPCSCMGDVNLDDAIDERDVIHIQGELAIPISSLAPSSPAWTRSMSAVSSLATRLKETPVILTLTRLQHPNHIHHY